MALSACDLPYHEHGWLWVPAFAGTTAYLVPKIAEPTRTCVAPNWIAMAKSALMPIHRMNSVEQGDRLFRLVGLQRPDQMQCDALMSRHQPRPFRLGFLHAVFAEHALPGRDHRLNRIGLEGFRHRDQRHRCALAPC